MSGRTRLALLLSAGAHAAVMLLPWGVPPGVRVEPLATVALLPPIEVREAPREAPPPPREVPREPSPATREPAAPVPPAVTPRSPEDVPEPEVAAVDPEPTLPPPQEADMPAAAVDAAGGEENPPAGSGNPAPAGEAPVAARAAEPVAPVTQVPPSPPARDPDALAAIHERIRRSVGYPSVARKRGWQGRATVRFMVDGDGAPRPLELVGSSGFGLLDRATLDGVTAGAPYPRVEGWVTVPVVFRLQG